MSRKLKESEVSINSGCTNFLTTDNDRHDNEGVYICGGPSYGVKFQDGERIDSYPAEFLMHLNAEIV